ncbi:MAG: ion transporter [Proteobacteria bacterium]|nr:ion transporter [Pseudomonadota bacterium]MBU1137489.1 ion transporter [Pseudomonadota bacterium]MBU1233425.1 ion transporter [Pseudomonadota bacterium]MBU1420092.1 ion transporter [Pseudomonadota bacterium]MBU1454545.1 ion transporter [Pseudomonadota bacterium]
MISKDTLSEIINETDTILGKAFALSIQMLIVTSLISFSISTLPNLSKGTVNLLRIVEIFTVCIFTIEYLLRILVAEKKLKFIFSFFGLVDLAAILPFYIATGFDIRSVRIFRLLRLVRILKLLKYSKATTLFHRALIISKEELILFGFVASIMLYLSAVGIYYFENPAQPDHFKSVFHCLWWAITTLTTVGYGDMFPVTTGGKLFTFFVLTVGLGIVAIPTGLVASALSQARNEDKAEQISTQNLPR